MILLASFLLLMYVPFTGLILSQIYKGNSSYILLYIICFLPFYTIFQVIVFNAFENIIIINSIKYSKDLVFFSSFILYLFGSKKFFLNRTFSFSSLDKLIFLFLILVFLYLIIPLGEANFLSKFIYAKNIFLIGILYFLGRNSNFKVKNWNLVLKLLISVCLLAFLISFVENIVGVHLHSFLGYSEYNLMINDIDPQGNFGLNWSFEGQGAIPRYASFFADPLEFSASLILFFAISIWFFIHSRQRQTKLFSLFLIFIVIFSLFLSLSRGTIFSAILMLVFGLFLSKNYKIILSSLCFVTV